MLAASLSILKNKVFIIIVMTWQKLKQILRPAISAAQTFPVDPSCEVSMPDSWRVLGG